MANNLDEAVDDEPEAVVSDEQGGGKWEAEVGSTELSLATLLSMPQPDFGEKFSFHDTPVAISNKGTPLTVKGLSASIAAVRKGLDEALDGNTHTELDQLALRFVTVLLGKSSSSKSSSSSEGSGRVKLGKKEPETNKNLESAETILRLADPVVVPIRIGVIIPRAIHPERDDEGDENKEGA